MSHRASSMLAWACCLAVLLAAAPAQAWIENHVTGSDVRIELDREGRAVVEHRLTLQTNGSERLRGYTLNGIDEDAEPLSNAYAVPARDALSSSLESAVPLSLERVERVPRGGGEPTAELALKVDDPRGLRRGSYVLVFRYRTDLRARQRIAADGAMVRITWIGPLFDDGFAGARTTFVVPRAPTAPRAGQAPDGPGDDTLPPTFLSEVRRGSERDEIELFRTYASKGEPVRWSVRVDPRALEPLPEEEAAPPDAAERRGFPRGLAAAALALFVGYALLVWLKAREVRRLAAAARAAMPPLVPLPGWARAPLAAAALVAGLALQLALRKPLWGAGSVLLACLLAAHGAARPDARAAMRGPGRWLTVSEREVFGALPRPRGAFLDVSTRWGKALALLLLGGVGAASWWLWQRALSQGLLVALDAVALLAIFGTGRMRALPPDLAVEPAPMLRKVARRLRKKKSLVGARIVPRIRIPHGGVDADELRLTLVPRMPLRGFLGIEIGVSYALGLGARVAMPEVLLRVLEGSPCHEAVAALGRFGRSSPGRRPDERVIALAPRLPTVHMTVEIAAALALRVMDREALARAGAPRPPRALAA